MLETIAYARCCDQVLTDLRLQGAADFAINTSSYYPNSCERCVEIPWAISSFRGEERILDVGVSLTDQVYLHNLMQLFDLGTKEIHGIDIVPLKRTLKRFAGFPSGSLDQIIFRNGDVRSTGYPDNYFDLIFLISTVEHVGFDEESSADDTVFNRPLEAPSSVPDLGKHRGDLQAMGELGRIVKPGGGLLVSVPFGLGGAVMVQDSKQRYCFFVQYDYSRWQMLLASSGLRLAEERFFGHSSDSGWREVVDPDMLRNNRYLKEQGMAQSVACARLTK